MSLGILVLFITINNPHANIDTLTGSLEEYEYYLTQLKRMFDGNSKLNVNNKILQYLPLSERTFVELTFFSG